MINFELNLDDKKSISRALQGADTLYFTYWVRFNNYLGVDRNLVLKRSENLIDCAKKENIKKIVFISHTNTN